MAFRIHQSESALAARKYYLQGLARADYYGRGGSAASSWLGKGAERLGLEGEVGKDDFFALLDNRVPGAGGERLTVRDGKNRRPGWDIVMSGPKSVSVLRHLGDDHRIWQAEWESAVETAEEIEARGIRTRVRRGGQDTTARTGSLIGSLFGHDTTRPLSDGRPDMFDHFHLYVQNATWWAREGRFQAAEMGDVYLSRAKYQTAFEARLSKKLAALGYRIERDADGWQIAGVPRSVLRKFSRRTLEIEEEAKRRNISDPVEKDRLGARLRRKKGAELPPGALRRYWENKLTPEERQAITDTIAGAGGQPGGGMVPGETLEDRRRYQRYLAKVRGWVAPDHRQNAHALAPTNG